MINYIVLNIERIYNTKNFPNKIEPDVLNTFSVIWVWKLKTLQRMYRPFYALLQIFHTQVTRQNVLHKFIEPVATWTLFIIPQQLRLLKITEWVICFKHKWHILSAILTSCLENTRISKCPTIETRLPAWNGYRLPSRFSHLDRHLDRLQFGVKKL